MSSPPRGLEGVVAVRTRLSQVDGKRGVLIVSGYPVEELAGKVTFEDAAYLLWNGRLPNRSEAEVVHHEIAALRPIPDITVALVVEAAKRGVPAMDALRMACSTLSLDFRDADAIRSRCRHGEREDAACALSDHRCGVRSKPSRGRSRSLRASISRWRQTSCT
jgi:citrate synthase